MFFDRDATMLWVLTAVIVTNGFVRGYSLYASSVTLGRIGNAVVARVQSRLFDHMLNLGVDFYNRTPASELVTRMSHNATAARQVLDTVITSAGRDFLSLVGLIIVMFIQSPTDVADHPRGRPDLDLRHQQAGQAGARRRPRPVHLADRRSSPTCRRPPSASASSRLSTSKPVMRKRMAASIDDVRARADKIVQIGARTSPLMEVLGGFAIAMIVLWAGYQTIYYDVKPGALMSFIAAIALAYEPAKRLARMQITLEAGLVGVRLMYELLDTPPTIETNARTAPALTVSKGEVVFDRVDFAYRRRRSHLFRGFDFTAAGGQTTALVGPSGAGKSSVISLIERFFDVDGGRILIDGQNIAEVNVASLRDHMALVSQDTVLFHDTIRENIRFGRPDASDADVERAARRTPWPTISSWRPRTATTPRSATTPCSSPAASASASPSPAPCCATRASSCSTRRPRRSIPNPSTRCSSPSSTCARAAPPSSSPTACRRCSAPTRSASWSTARSSSRAATSELLALGKHYARLYHLQFERHKPVAETEQPEDLDETEASRSDATAVPAE